MSTILNNASMIIDIDSKEGSRIMAHQGNQDNILKLKLKLCQKGWKNQINKGHVRYCLKYCLIQND
jgi:hypothetical protein